MTIPDPEGITPMPEVSATAGPRDKLWKRLWRHRTGRIAMIVLGLLVLAAVLAPWIAPHDPFASGIGAPLSGPSGSALLGTDEMGRDILSRLLYGTRVSLGVATLAVLGALAVGLPIGLVAGFIGGRVDGFLMRIIDGMLAFPSLILALALAVTIGEGILTVVIAIAFIAIPTYARLVRAVTMQTKALGYVEASLSIGTPKRRIAIRHVIPNIMGPLSVQSTLNAANAILLEASLSFLGVGVPLPNPSWGGMVKSGVPYLEISSAVVLIPGLCIFVAVMSLNLVGDALRDALDARIN